MKKKIISGLAALMLAGAGVLVGVTAAHAAPPDNCSQTPGVPFKSGQQIKGTGTGECSTNALRTLDYEVHRSQGWWHPVAAHAVNAGNKKSYSATASNCDSGSGTSEWKYFGQVKFVGYSYSISGNTGNLNICG